MSNREPSPVSFRGFGRLSVKVKRNDNANNEVNSSSSAEITSAEIDEINHNERTTRRRYYQQMDKDALPGQESLKWIQRIKEQFGDGKMSC